MTGTYSNELNTMQNALTAYTNALQSFLENTKEIRATFNEIAQNEALKDQRATLNSMKSDSVSRISAAAEKLKERITTNWTPKEQLYNREVIAMLQDGLIPYSASDIESMAETRFKDNPTMLQVLRGYVDKHNLLSQLKNNSVLLYSSKAKKLAAADALSEELIGIIGSASQTSASPVSNSEDFVPDFSTAEVTGDDDLPFDEFPPFPG